MLRLLRRFWAFVIRAESLSRQWVAYMLTDRNFDGLITLGEVAHNYYEMFKRAWRKDGEQEG